MSQCAIAYYRVSTQRQGRSGLGIEAQRSAVARFAEAEGIAIIGEFTEVETGKAQMRWTDGHSSPPHSLLLDSRSAQSS